MKSLLIIGRFQPFHLGHLAIIKKYYSKGYFIKIGIGSVEKDNELKNPFTAKERDEMIRVALSKEKILHYAVYHIPDIENDNAYAKHVERIMGHFDVLFTGNPLVKNIFKEHKEKYNKPFVLNTFNENKDRVKGINATEIRKRWLDSNSRKGLPRVVFGYLKNILASDRLKEMHDPKKKVHYLLRSNNLTISAAESCTGGAISRALISYPGASQFFKAGIVAYSIESKIHVLGVSKKIIKTKGAISMETSIEMARKSKILSRSDYSISSTGYADPSDPLAGTVFICVSGKNGEYMTKLQIKKKKRDEIISEATKQAMDFLHRVIKKEIFE
jgi:nicotinamide-nucleotide adenylyltransferase